MSPTVQLTFQHRWLRRGGEAHFVLGVSIGGELPMYGFGFTYSAVFGLFGGPLFGCQADFWAAPAGCSGAVSKQTVD